MSRKAALEVINQAMFAASIGANDVLYWYKIYNRHNRLVWEGYARSTNEAYARFLDDMEYPYQLLSEEFEQLCLSVVTFTV